MSTQPLIAPKSGGNFPPVSEGIVQGVIAEVRNLGLQDETFNGETKKVHKILLRWQTGEMDKGRPAEGQNAAVPPAPKRLYEKFTFSNHEKAKLRKRVEGIYGQPPPDNFDYNKLVGVQRNLMVVHKTSQSGAVFANIVGTTKLNPGQAKLEIVAIPDAKPKTPQGTSPAQPQPRQAGANAVTQAAPIDESDIPF